MISFTVKGVPIPQGSMKAFAIKTKSGKHRAIVTSANPKLKQWRQIVSAEAQKAMGLEHPAGKNVPIRVEAIFFLPRAKSNKSMDAVKMPDLDKLTRGILDSLTGYAFTDDSQVVELHCFKAYGEPRAEIRVEEVGVFAVPFKSEPVLDKDIPF